MSRMRERVNVCSFSSMEDEPDVNMFLDESMCSQNLSHVLYSETSQHPAQALSVFWYIRYLKCIVNEQNVI